MSVADRLGEVRARIEAAAARAGRDPGGVTLVGVSKKQPSAKIDEAIAAGLRDLGENYAQELLDKVERMGDGARWHFIGRLQSNKLKLLVGKTHLIHAVDAERHLRELDRRAAEASVTQRVLLSVNVAGEASKSGVSPDQARTLLAAADELRAVEVAGFMTMPPLSDDPAASRPHFAALRALRDRLATPSRPLSELSMGTTADYEVAVEEGATLVRVGTAVFGARTESADRFA